MEVETQTKQAQKQLPSPLSTDQQPSSLTKIIFVASIAAGIQFGWALQLSLLTPYVQLLGIPHTWAAFIWLCGPISGMLVQPIVGYYSDRCTSRFGRRRPFIVAGAALVATAVFLIGFAADMGHAFGDSLEKKTKPRAVAIFVVGFWILDVANNMLQGPCRALLADLSGDDQKKMRTANAFFSFFMAVGNVLGYAAGSYKHLYKIFSFTKTKACDVYCANLKSCFFISITLLLTLTAIGLACVKEKTQTELAKERGENENDKSSSSSSSSSTMLPFFGEILGAFKELQRPMWILLLVTCLNWIGWFPFLLFDTDWMGKEVYGGKVGDGPLYDMGVRAGSLGLMLNSVVLGFMSLGIAFLAKRLGGIKRVWGIGNIVLAICMALTVLITKLAESHRHGHPGINSPPPTGVKVGALALFSVLGIPLAVTYTIPFALASIFSSTSGAGQGLSLGVLNISICIPQMIVSVLSGPWDALFGGGNVAAFVVGGIAAAVSGILALTLLPSPPSQLSNSKDIPVGFH